MSTNRDIMKSLSRLKPEARRFVLENYKELVQRHPGYANPQWDLVQLEFWTHFYMEDEKRFEIENHRCVSQLPEGHDPPSNTSLQPADEGLEDDEDSERHSRDLISAWRIRLLQDFDIAINHLSEEGELTPKEAQSLAMVKYIVSEPDNSIGAQRVAIYGGININALTKIINQRAGKAIISNKTLEKAMTKLLNRLKISRGKSGFIRKQSQRRNRKQENSMKKPSTIEQTLDNLEAIHSRLTAAEPASELVEEAGYAAVHASRYATEMVFQELHEVADIAPDLKGEEIYGVTFDQARSYLRKSLEETPKRDSPKERTMLAVAKLAEALDQRSNTFQLAVLAKEVAILLLGPQRLGCVFAEWQTSTLGVGLLTWEEQEKLNRRVLSMARGLDQQSAHRDSERFELPPVSFVEVGCYGNIATACFRAVADNELGDFSADHVLEIGSQALQRIEREVAIDPEQYTEYIPPIYAMEAALRELLGSKRLARTFWERLPMHRAAQVVRQVQEREPSLRLRGLVLESVRNAGVEI